MRPLPHLRPVLRSLLRRPAWTAAAILTLALGLGATTAVWSVVDAALLRPLPFASPEELVFVWETQGDWRDRWVAPANFLDWRREARSFAAMAAFRNADVALAGDGAAERVRAQTVTADFFDVLGLAPRLGRGFRGEDDREGGLRTVVLAHALWQRRFGGDPGVLGRTVEIDREPHAVVGVMPAGFRLGSRGGRPAEMWLLGDDGVAVRLPGFGIDFSQERDVHILDVVARLAPGVSRETAAAEMDALAARLADAYPATNEGLGAAVLPLREQLVGDRRPLLLTLLAAAGVVLAVACANLSGLLLVRGRGRSRELALRAALGAGRRGLLALVAAEGLALAVAGWAAGLLLAGWLLSLFARLAPSELGVVAAPTVDARVAAAGLAVALVAALAVGAAPAWAAARLDLSQALHDRGGRTVGGRGARRARRGLVVAQVALAQALLVAAALLGLSLQRLLAVDAGFVPEGLLTFELSLPDDPYADPATRRAFYDRLLERLAAVPGAEDAAAIFRLPPLGARVNRAVQIEGRPAPTADENLSADHQITSANVFAVLGNPIVAGRPLLASDGPDAPRVAVVNETMAGRDWPGEDPIGKRLFFGREDQAGNPRWVTVVGVARDLRQHGLAEPAAPALFTPYAQDDEPWTVMSFAVRAAGDPAALAPAALAIVAELDPALPVAELLPMTARIAETVARERLTAALVGGFATLTLVLAAIGIHGVVAQATAQRTREIGLRMALGAHRRTVLRGVLGEGVAVAVAGAVLGTAAALPAGRLLASQLFAVDAHDPAVAAAVAALVTTAALAATWRPAHRAAAIDPATALRSE